jgi:glucans biosynthesis protein
VNRRDFLQVSVALPLVASSARGLFTPANAQAAPFERSSVRQLARDAAGKPFKAPDSKLPDNLKDLDYDRYRAIRFLPDRALWRGEKLRFEVQPCRRRSRLRPAWSCLSSMSA